MFQWTPQTSQQEFRENSRTSSAKARNSLARGQHRIPWLLRSRCALLITRHISCALIFSPRAFAPVMGTLPEKIYYSGEREEQRRSRCRRASCRRRSSREIYGCQAFTTALHCARVCAIKRACGPFKSRHGLSIKKRKPDNGCQDVHALYFHNSASYGVI